MVHDNPALEPYTSNYKDAEFLRQRNFDGKVFTLFDCAQYGLLWDEFDEYKGATGQNKVYPVGSTERKWVEAKRQELHEKYNEVGAVVLVLAGFVPVVSLVFASLPEAVLGGCTIMMFGNIIVSGFQMIANAGFSQRNITIAALSLAVGIGFTQMGDIFAIFPELVQSVFADNCVAVVFVVAILASLLLPKDQKVEGPLIVEEGNDSVDIATRRVRILDPWKPSRT